MFNLFHKLFARHKFVQPPTRLFKYKPINEWIEPIILNNELYFSARRNLNDPNESTWRATTSATDNEIKCAYRNLLRSNPSQYQLLVKLVRQSGDIILATAFHFGPDSPYFDEAIPFIRRKLNKNLDALKNAHERMIDEETGICCFSEVGDSIKMFAHYADSQRGCCLEFGPKSEILHHIDPVNYVDDIPVLDVWEDDDVAIRMATLFCKSKEWAEEREWRMIRYPKGQGSFRLDLDIKSLTFGCYTKEEDKEYIKSLLNRRDSSLGNIELFQAHKSPNSYKLERIPLRLA